MNQKIKQIFNGNNMNVVKSPFKFLDSYQKDDHDIFFGREKRTAPGANRVFKCPMTTRTNSASRS